MIKRDHGGEILDGTQAAKFSTELKQRIVRSVKDEGLSQADTARRRGVSESTVSRLVRALRERGALAPVELERGPKPRLELEQHERQRALAAESPFLSTYELTPLFDEAFPEVAVHRSTSSRALHQLGLSFNEQSGSPRRSSRRS